MDARAPLVRTYAYKTRARACTRARASVNYKNIPGRTLFFFHSSRSFTFRAILFYNTLSVSYFCSFQHLFWQLSTSSYLLDNQDTLFRGYIASREEFERYVYFFLLLKIVRSIIFYKLRKSIFPFCNASSISIMNMIMFKVFL
jgi:hypothetical protein